MERFGSTYSGIKIDDKAALLYNVFYMLRRLWIAFLVTFIKHDSYLQVILFMLHSVLMLTYIGYVKPFELPLLNKLEIFNELSILSATYHLTCFTGFVDDAES